ncbi:hypothetical protein BDM02DRAFT_3186132 [Thelephora ganbajun]|uniref:Uncharacterized protein n=1 Tax=Thelephora ganbajun TaxID=370292 RepID=A0ACB6ZIK9_THEGA|nr:hypothetical protein BDM02DRAFT_3186132 [Thelephora ganbajun]
MSKRSRSDSLDAATVPQIPRMLKSETPEIRETAPHHGATRGVESVRIEEATDRNTVMQDTILRLHQSGRRVIDDPIVLPHAHHIPQRESIDGSKNMTFEWLLDYQVREKLEPRESEPNDLWRPASMVRTQSQGIHPHRASVASEKQSQARAWLSTFLGGGETFDDPIVIDGVEEVSVESTGHHSVSDSGPSGASRTAASNPAELAGTAVRDELEDHQGPANNGSEDSDSEGEEPDSGATGEDSDADRNVMPLPHPPFSPQLLPVLAHDWELSEEEFLTNEALPPRRKTGPAKGRKKRPETGRPGTVAVPRDNPTIVSQPSRKHIRLPLPPNGRARRLACSSTLDIWCAVTMRGDVQFINGIEHTKLPDLSMPGESHHHVEDACLVGNTLVIGYGASDRSVETQIETLNLNEFVNENDRLFFRNALLHPPHCDRGISSLAPVDNRRFLSGGYDKRIHLWTFSSEDSSIKTNDMKLYLNTPVRAIGYAPETKTAYVGSGRRIWNLKVEKPTNTEGLPISSEVNNIHVNLHEPDLVVLEVDDLDEQVHLFDIRAGGFKTQPAVRFGHRMRANGSARHSPSSYRYSRGSLSHCHFARGFADGYVFVWDFRNPKKVAVKLESRDEKQNVVHTAISGLDVAAFSTGVVTVYNQVV